MVACSEGEKLGLDGLRRLVGVGGEVGGREGCRDVGVRVDAWRVVGAKGMIGGSCDDDDDEISGSAAMGCCKSSSKIEVNGFMVNRV